jgi:hypothetical protein
LLDTLFYTELPRVVKKQHGYSATTGQGKGEHRMAKAGRVYYSQEPKEQRVVIALGHANMLKSLLSTKEPDWKKVKARAGAIVTEAEEAMSEKGS